MKTFSTLTFVTLFSAATSSLMVRAADSSVNEHLRPLEWLVGTWQGEAVVENGDSGKVRVEVKPSAGGTVLLLNWRLVGEGDEDLSGVILYYWKPEQKSLASLAIDSTGQVAAEVAVDEATSRWTWQGFGYDEGRAFKTQVTQLRRLDNNRWSMLFEHQVAAGEPKPDIKVTLTRAAVSVTQELTTVLNELNRAMVQRDSATLDKILTDDCTIITADGRVVTKAAIRKGLESGDYTVSSSDTDEIRVKVHGDMATVAFRWTGKERFRGNELNSVRRGLESFVKEDGQWRCISAQFSTIPTDSAAGSGGSR